ncbi:MAG: hypothetical protein V7752_07950 [Halopseudomonas sp.]
MPAIHSIDNHAKIILTIWEGEAVDADLIDAIENYQQQVQNDPDYLGYNEVVDFSDVTKIKLTSAGIKNISRIAAKSDRSETQTRLAFIVSSKLAFGLARMYETYRSFGQKNKEVRVFRNKDDAYEWVLKIQ